MIREPLSSSLARQPLVGPDLLKKLCPFVSVEGDILPILNLQYSDMIREHLREYYSGNL